LQAQVRDLQAAGCTKIFQEQVSSIAERAELARALDYVRGGDTLVVTMVDRLARSTVGLWEIVKRLEAVDDGGAGLRILNLGGETVDTTSATGRLFLTIFAGFAQFEREMICLSATGTVRSQWQTFQTGSTNFSPDCRILGWCLDATERR